MGGAEVRDCRSADRLEAVATMGKGALLSIDYLLPSVRRILTQHLPQIISPAKRIMISRFRFAFPASFDLAFTETFSI